MSVVVEPGAPASFTVAATACLPPTYQWLKNGVPIPGATSATFAIAAVGGQDPGTYRVAVTAGTLSTLSDFATLNTPLPVFTANSCNVSPLVNCGSQATIYWQTVLPANFVLEYDFTAGVTFPTSLPHTVSSGPATSGTLMVPCPAGMRFLCYRIRAVDPVNQSATTPDRMAALPPSSFSTNLVAPSVVGQPYAATLSAPGDAVGLGIQVQNSNCTALSARCVVTTARLNTAIPRTSAGGSALPSTVADAIAARTTVRMPGDLRFRRSQVGGVPGSNASFSGTLTIQTTPPVTRSFSATIKLP